MTHRVENLELHAGDEQPVAFRITTSDSGVPIDISGATVRWAITTNPGAASKKIFKSSTATSTGDIALSATSTGRLTITLRELDTAGLFGYFFHELEIEIAGLPFTALTGRVEISRNTA